MRLLRSKFTKKGLESHMTMDNTKDLVDYIKDSADELLHGDKSQYSAGQMLAYYDVLLFIQEQLPDRLAEVGLDFDLDKKYLFDNT
jgi:hypothetical protein